MCTVTIVPLNAARANSGFRLACNRDESTRRPAALPPVSGSFGDRFAVMPVDPVSGGTWIAVNDAGLAMTLLNGTPRPVTAGAYDPRDPRISRGLIIPTLIDCASSAQAERRALHAIEPARHAPFRLVITDGRQLTDLVSDGRALTARRAALGNRPHMFTSSGLGDLLVRGPRTRLFEAFFHSTGDPVRRQDLFHRHSWPERPHLSVCMNRPGARTISHTIVESGSSMIAMTYLPGPPDTMRAGNDEVTRIELGPDRLTPARAAC